MKLADMERRIVLSSRYMSIAAVIGSLAGSVLMFFLGLYNIYRAFAEGLQVPEEEDATAFGSEAVISVIEGLDRFLIAIVLLYFAYGVYSLFLHPESSQRELALPDWLKVKQVGQLKQVVAEVIIVVLFVLFLRVALQAFHSSDAVFAWKQLATLMVLPVSVFLLACALRMVQLHPKPRTDPDETADADQPRDERG
ncbi:hypothetical protein A3731_02230 [Roseovarius sp. HI0049]|nr:hypothetical protein A3731_02230 [Roseovarius sp. HI0049]